MSIYTYRIKVLAFMVLSSSVIAQAMSFDNRYFPLLQHQYVTVEERPSHANINVFATTAHEAYNILDDNTRIGIPEIYGLYDQNNLGEALVAIGKTNPIPTPLQDIQLPWSVQGKIESVGFSMGYHQHITPYLSFGFNLFALQCNSYQDFSFNHNDLTQVSESEAITLEDVRREIHTQLGLQGPFSRQAGLSDIDVNIRMNKWWEYIFKFKRIDVGFRLGCIFPTGEERDVNSPSSVPFGGNGHYGMYGAFDAEVELKEDWKVGLFVRLNKRFKRTKIERMPVDKEPYLFGAVVGPVSINPGVTAIVSPYASLENIREGLGARLQYTWQAHAADTWCDKRTDQTISVNLKEVPSISAWRAGYVSVSVFYDFGKVKVVRGLEPIVSFVVDYPLGYFGCKGSSKTYRGALSIECNF